jgi:hypothetical protein
VLALLAQFDLLIQLQLGCVHSPVLRANKQQQQQLD